MKRSSFEYPSGCFATWRTAGVFFAGALGTTTFCAGIFAGAALVTTAFFLSALFDTAFGPLGLAGTFRAGATFGTFFFGEVAFAREGLAGAAIFAIFPTSFLASALDFAGTCVLEAFRPTTAAFVAFRAGTAFFATLPFVRGGGAPRLAGTLARLTERFEVL
jgi:hypothetical protein